MKQMSEAKEKAQAELEEYSSSTADEIRSRLESEGEADISQAEESFAENHEDWDNEWQSRIDQKQKQMAAVKRKSWKISRKKRQDWLLKRTWT